MTRARKKGGLLSSGLALALSACAAGGPIGPVAEMARPTAAPQSATTRFESALQCMDAMFADYGVSNVSIAVSGVPDYTGEVYVGSDIWLQTSITKMSQRSHAFVVTDFNPSLSAPEQSLWALVTKNDRFYVPAYYVRGAISGYAENVVSKSANASAGLPFGNIGANASRGASLVSVDLTIGDLLQRTLITRAHAGNEVTLQSSAAGAQMGATVHKLGASLDFTVSRNEGVPQAVRALVELSAIEIMGRLTGAPYWACLDGKVSPAEVARARQDIYSSMTSAERLVFAQRRLTRLGFYKGALNGQTSDAFKAAVASYARARDLPSPDPDSFALYEALTDWSPNTSAPGPLPAAAAATLPVAAAASPTETPLRLELRLTGATSPGAAVSLSIRPTKAAFSYCYLQDRSGAVSRVFPNRWQPDPLVQAQQTLEVPGPKAGFQLVLPTSGTEELSCFTSSQELTGTLPEVLRQQDLAPLPVPSLTVLATLFQIEAKRRSAELTISEQALRPQ